MRKFSCCAAILLGSTSAAVATSVPVNDFSFEQTTGSLANPLVNPPLAGAIGGWQVSRSGLLPLTGLTAPRVATVESAAATEGENMATVSFVLGVASEASYSQTLSSVYQGNTCYALTVDVGTAGLADALATVSLRLLAGSEVVADSDEGALLRIVDLGGGFSQFTITFAAGAAPPQGNIGIELGAEGVVDLVSSVAFDRVRLDARSLVCPSDMDRNGEIALQDLAFLLSDFGCVGQCIGDLDCDADTDLSDLTILLSDFGSRCP